jgi:hypothetical protein
MDGAHSDAQVTVVTGSSRGGKVFLAPYTTANYYSPASFTPSSIEDQGNTSMLVYGDSLAKLRDSKACSYEQGCAGLPVKMDVKVTYQVSKKNKKGKWTTKTVTTAKSYTTKLVGSEGKIIQSINIPNKYTVLKISVKFNLLVKGKRSKTFKSNWAAIW